MTVLLKYHLFDIDMLTIGLNTIAIVWMERLALLTFSDNPKTMYCFSSQLFKYAGSLCPAVGCYFFIIPPELLVLYVQIIHYVTQSLYLCFSPKMHLCWTVFDSEVKDYIYRAVRPTFNFRKFSLIHRLLWKCKLLHMILAYPVNQMECMSTRGFTHIIMVIM